MEHGRPILAVGKFLALLRELNSSGPVSRAQLANATGIPRQTTSRMLQTMLSLDLIEQVPNTKRYRVAAMALSLSHGYEPAHRLAFVARPIVEQLTSRIGWPVTVMTHVGTSMITRFSTHHLTSLSFGPCPVGSAIPILHSASGHAYLAFASTDDRLAILDGFRRLDDRSPLLSMFIDGRPLELIRAAGYASYERSAHTPHPGKTSSISVPIVGFGPCRGALTMDFFSSAMSMAAATRRFVRELKDAATAIVQALDPLVSGPTCLESSRSGIEGHDGSRRYAARRSDAGDLSSGDGRFTP